MPEVPDHLVPRDGLTNSNVEFNRLDMVQEEDAVVVRFTVYNEDRERFGTLTITVNKTESETLDGLVTVAHRQLRDMFRQWVLEINKMREHYARSTL